MAIAGHAIGNDSGKHAFEGGQQRHGEGRRNERQNVLGVEVGNGEGRETAGNSAKARTDGFHWQMKQCARNGARKQSHNGRGNTLGETRQDQHDGQRRGADGECLPVEAGHMTDQKLHPGQEFTGDGPDAKAEEILDLRRDDKDGDAVGESDDDGPRE